MGVDPVRPGIAYRTDKDLRSLFTTFPRADDGSKAEFPNLLADTIQPVIDLGETSTIGVTSLVLERLRSTAVAPATATPTIIVPPAERWIIWRMRGIHSDTGVTHKLTMFLLQPGPGWAGISVPIQTTTLADNETHVVAEGPWVIGPLGQVITAIAAALTVGSITQDLVITRFQLADVLPATFTMGF